MSARKSWFLPLIAVVVLLAGSPARALINPYFTPIHLVQQADVMLKVTLKAGDKPQTLKVEVLEGFKPKAGAPKGPLVIDLTTAPHKDHATEVAKLVAARPNEPALLFAGDFKEEREGGAEQLPEAMLHFQGRWLGLYKADGGGYEMDKISSHMEATWAGSTDMLERAVRYILHDPAPTVPVTAEAHWDRHEKAGKVEGNATASMAIDLADGQAQTLFVASDGGDKLFAWDAKEKKLADVTARHKLTSKSTRALWGDFDHDGKLDLASFDGKALTLHLQQADGTFQPKPLQGGAALDAALKDGCLSLSLVDAGQGGRAGILVGAPSWPVLLVNGPDKWTASPLGTGELPGASELGKGGLCLVGDLDGDLVPDVLQLFAERSLFHKGKALGQFDKPVTCEAALGEGRATAFFGDYDGDGLLDVMALAEDCVRLWHNQGGGKFVQIRRFSGEIDYISKGCGVEGMTGDNNNDGRQDVLIIYSNMGPHLFFNRGFRSFGHSHDLDLAERQLLEESHQGLQSGCLGDFSGNGAQDMALVLKNGEVWTFYRKVFEEDAALSIRISLALKGGYAGPLTVTAFSEKRCLGAWNVTAGSQFGFVAQQIPGSTCVLKWQLPGGKPQQKEITLIDKAERLVIETEKK